MAQKRLSTLITLLVLTLITIYILFPYHTQSQTLLPANSTLGFGTILAVSHAHSPRRSSLLWAVNLTDLEIVIPDQPEWTEGDLQAFRAEESQISRGSALAWLGHLNALRWFLSTSHATALILEDDTDFSLHIRQVQIPLLAAAVRNLFNTTSASLTTHTNNDNQHYWADPKTWHILYPGHCDDLPQPLSHPCLAYTDRTTPHTTHLHPDTQSFLSALNLPPQTRILHRTRYPFCTFAYAVTRSSASLILERYSKEKEGGITAYDVQLLEACRDELSCWSVAPEVFHHVVGGSEISRHDEGARKGTEQDVGVEVPGRGTWNLECGARDKRVWVDAGGVDGRERAKRMVKGIVRRGECPLDAADGDKGWKGCEWEECGAQS